MRDLKRIRERKGGNRRCEHATERAGPLDLCCSPHGLDKPMVDVLQIIIADIVDGACATEEGLHPVGHTARKTKPQLRAAPLRHSRDVDKSIGAENAQTPSWAGTYDASPLARAAVSRMRARDGRVVHPTSVYVLWISWSWGLPGLIGPGQVTAGHQSPARDGDGVTLREALLLFPRTVILNPQHPVARVA